MQKEILILEDGYWVYSEPCLMKRVFSHVYETIADFKAVLIKNVPNFLKDDGCLTVMGCIMRRVALDREFLNARYHDVC